MITPIQLVPTSALRALLPVLSRLRVRDTLLLRVWAELQARQIECARTEAVDEDVLAWPGLGGAG